MQFWSTQLHGAGQGGGDAVIEWVEAGDAAEAGTAPHSTPAKSYQNVGTS